MAENQIREQIRQAYTINDADAPSRMIPADKKININEDGRPMTVCAYCRVSTDNDEQLSSFVLQQEHYSHLASSHKNWNLKRVYADATVIIGLKQNPTIGRRFSPIFSFIEHLSGKYGRCYT